jgi:uncharacterized membrane protein YeaQ/YmgE (transglycosylase-associated protein family)
MACILAGLILFSAVAKSVAPPPWILRGTLQQTNLARFGFAVAELTVVAALLSQRWVAAATAALFAIARSWWRARGVSGGTQDCDCFGARRPSPQRSWRDRVKTAVVLGCLAGTITTAVVPAASPHPVVLRIGLVLVGGVLGQVLWPLKDLWFSTEWLRQNAGPLDRSAVIWTVPLSVRFGLRGVTVGMLMANDPPCVDITIHWIPPLWPRRHRTQATQAQKDPIRLTRPSRMSVPPAAAYEAGQGGLLDFDHNERTRQ